MATVTMRMDQATRWRDKAFFGHPRGLAWPSFTELWERFSYYGMQALLVLYMTHQLLQPGHVEHVFGFGPFRRLLESVYGPLSPQALASNIFGLYAGLVYLTPIAGGFLADRVIGRTRAVTLGALLMAAGHFLMAFDVSFLMALTCLLLGVGCFKGNISGQVGDLYAPNDPRRADAFQIFLFAVQIAVIASPFVCGTLGQVYGWHWGFGAAGVGMLIGLGVYLSGRRWLPDEALAAQRKSAEPRPPMTAADTRNIVVLALLVPVLAFSAVGNQQIFNAYLIWGEANYQLTFFGRVMPITWILSFGSIISASTIALSVMFWRWWATRRTEPSEITKMAIGASIAALAPLMLAAVALVSERTGHKVSLGWAFAFEFINDVGFSNLFPIGIALYSRCAPKGFSGMLIGIYYIHLFLGNMLVGWLGGLLEHMQGSAFWLMHAALVFGSAAILLLARKAAGKVLAPPYKDEPAPEASAEPAPA